MTSPFSKLLLTVAILLGGWFLPSEGSLLGPQAAQAAKKDKDGKKKAGKKKGKKGKKKGKKGKKKGKKGAKKKAKANA